VVNVRYVAQVKAGVSCAGLYKTSKIFNVSRDVVKVAHLGTKEKMSPFVRRERADRTFRIVRITNQDEFTLTCYFDARATLAGT
jgi:hypothetical protein